MNQILPFVGVAVFAGLLIALVAALIMNEPFRVAVLGNPGEATVFGLITVKGVAIVLLCGLFVGGLIASINLSRATETPCDCTKKQEAVQFRRENPIEARAIKNSASIPDCMAARTGWQFLSTTADVKLETLGKPECLSKKDISPDQACFTVIAHPTAKEGGEAVCRGWLSVTMQEK